MRSRSILAEHTDIPPEKSAAEITAELVKAGARQISTDYGDGGKITGMRWALRIGRQDVHFALPARVDAVYTLLKKRTSGSPDLTKLRAKAERTAWRQLYRWVQAQNAMIETGMAQPHEVYMPYAVAPGHTQTMFQAWSAQLALPAGDGGSSA